MRTRQPRAGGGLEAIRYVWRKAREAGGLFRLYRRLRTRNACKTCAFGMGGQRGGMVNEQGRFPEVCKKSVQAQAGDMQGPIPEGFFAATPMAALERMGPRGLERLGRLAFPLLWEEGATHFRRISWEEALERTVAAFRAARPERTFFYASGRSSNEAAFLLQLLARVYGTNNVNNCSSYCHAASSVALSRVYGSGTASVVLEDLERADLALVAGANPASNHPRLVRYLVRLRRRGGKVIVVNPVREVGLVRFRIPSEPLSLLFGSTVSDLYLMPHVGGDIALFKALLKAVVERGGVDEAFVRAHTVGWEAVREDLERSAWQELLEAAGVSREEVDVAAGLLCRAERGIFMWAMGLTHHVHGVGNVLALANLALARGWLGRPGAGLLPIRGHSNVQGVGSMGVSPAVKDAFAERLAELYGVKLPSEKGLDTYQALEAAAAGRIQAALLLGGNLFGASPDRAWAAEALRRIPFVCALATKLNEGHIHGRGRSFVLLPVLARDEESQATTQESMFNYVRFSEGGEPAISGEMRSEVEIVARLAAGLLPAGRFDWEALRSHRALRAAIARVVPGYEAIGRMDETRQEFQIEGRTFHAPRFATADGRAHFHVVPVPTWPGEPGTFRLLTFRSEGQFNTVVYEEEDLYRGVRRRDVVFLNRRDGERLGLREGERVRVTTAAGSLSLRAAWADIREGSAAVYYPEGNVLVPRQVDPESNTPAFKGVVARLVREGAGENG